VFVRSLTHVYGGGLYFLTGPNSSSLNKLLSKTENTSMSLIMANLYNQHENSHQKMNLCFENCRFARLGFWRFEILSVQSVVCVRLQIGRFLAPPKRGVAGREPWQRHDCTHTGNPHDACVLPKIFRHIFQTHRACRPPTTRHTIWQTARNNFQPPPAKTHATNFLLFWPKRKKCTQ